MGNTNRATRALDESLATLKLQNETIRILRQKLDEAIAERDQYKHLYLVQRNALTLYEQLESKKNLMVLLSNYHLATSEEWTTRWT